MNVLITGASGFLGSQIVTDLLNAGHHVTCCVRNVEYTKRIFPAAKVISCNFIKDNSASIWLPRLKNIDVVINTVGIFYHPDKKIIWRIHLDTPKALFEACQKEKIKKIIHISALGVDKYDNDYAKSKLAAEKFLLTLSIPVIIFRPSFIYSQGSHGGSSLFRGLAALPFIIPVPAKGKQQFQPVYLPDLSTAIVNCVEKPLTTSVILHAASRNKISLRKILETIRQWLGLQTKMVLSVPSFFLSVMSLYGNFIPDSVINRQGIKMLLHDNITSESEIKKFTDFTNINPRNFNEGMFSAPATIQEKWHAKLYFVKPLLQFSLAFLWIFTAICSLWIFPREQSYELLKQTGINEFWQPIMLYGASLLDFVIGIALLLNIQVKKICLLQILIIIVYSIIITIKIPAFWFHPFGAISKNIPLLVAIYILYILE